MSVHMMKRDISLNTPTMLASASPQAVTPSYFVQDIQLSQLI